MDNNKNPRPNMKTPLKTIFLAPNLSTRNPTTGERIPVSNTNSQRKTNQPKLTRRQRREQERKMRRG